jgi:hypothetical protein
MRRGFRRGRMPFGMNGFGRMPFGMNEQEYGGRNGYAGEQEGYYGEQEGGPYEYTGEQEGYYGEQEGGPYEYAGEQEGYYGEQEGGPYEYAGEQEGYYGEQEGGPYEYTGEQEGYYGEQEGGPYEYAGEQEGVFNEAQEMELASELLSVTNEAELDHFFGPLLAGLAGPVAQALGGVLKGVASQALPMVASLLGNIGGARRSELGNEAERIFGLEMEGMSQEDQEFEAARRFVRLGIESIQQALNSPPTQSPLDIAQQAVEAAARLHAPGLLGEPFDGFGRHPRNRRRRGSWYRRGNRIVLVGV